MYVIFVILVHCFVLTFTDLLLINLSRVSPGPTIRHIMSTFWLL